jgi:hypothetical protein
LPRIFAAKIRRKRGVPAPFYAQWYPTIPEEHDMRRIFFCAIFLCTAFSACADRQAATVSNSSIPAEQAEELSEGAFAVDNKAASSESAYSAANTAANTGGGGGGGRRSAGHVVKQNISLTQTSASAIDTASSDRKIVRNAELNLEANDPEEAQRKITGIAELKGGFVVESQQSSSDIKASSRDTVTMTVRVPAERFSEALDEIRTTATRVVVETVKGQDVTEEFIDIEAQLKAKKSLEEQFMAIMKRANSVEDALEVQSQLADVRGEIERIEGRKRFLQNQSSL